MFRANLNEKVNKSTPISRPAISPKSPQFEILETKHFNTMFPNF
jgi:hypothetical protein